MLAYAANQSYIDYIDYRPIYEEAMGYLTQPTEELPTDVQWEVINNAFVTWLLGAYNMTAASSQVSRTHLCTGRTLRHARRRLAVICRPYAAAASRRRSW